MARAFSISIFAITAAFLGSFLLWPIVMSVQGAFFDTENQFTFTYVTEVFCNQIYLEGLRNAFLLALASLLAALGISLPLALVSDRFIFPGKRFLSAFILVPMILPPFVGAIGVKQILGQMGALNAGLIRLGIMSPDDPVDWLGQSRFWGVVAMNALHLYPILYLNIVASLANLDPAMEEAAENLGCTGFRKFSKITLPLILPGMFAGGTIVFIWSFTELGVPLMFDYTRVTPVQIFLGIREIAENPLPYALVVVTLLSSVLLYVASKSLFGRSYSESAPRATMAGSARNVGFLAGVACSLLFASVSLLAIAPHLGVVIVSFSGDWYGSILPSEWTIEHYREALGHGLTVPSIVNSLKYASASTLFDIVLGIAISCVVVRSTIPARGLLDAIAMLPLAVPGLVLAFGYVSMTQEGRLFQSLNPTTDPTALLIIAYAVRRLPYVVRCAVAGLQQTSVSFEEAAQNLGATPLRAIWKITLPLITANLIAGGLLAFSFAMLEVSDSLVLAQKQIYYPITKAIYELFQLLGDGRYVASALGVWSMLFLTLTIFATNKLMGRRMGAIFRM